MQKAALLCLATLMFAACHRTPRQITPAFYYWKAELKITEHERTVMKQMGVKKLYLRLYDVDWNAERNMPTPVSELQFADSLPEGIEVIPVIYITNNTLLNTKTAQIQELGDKMAQKLERMCQTNGIRLTEIQTDCDWTDNTQLKYFNLIKAMRGYFSGKNILFSSTIRLHQVKYYKRTGIPPVDKGILMFYNMGSIEDRLAENSIYNSKDAAKYISHLKNYPMALDMALPAYSWGIHFSDGKVSGLINTLSHADVKNDGKFMFGGGNIYTATSAFFYKGQYFNKGDELRIEEISPEVCKQAAEQLEKELNTGDITVSFYHLDSLNISRYQKEGYQQVLEVF
jgi:hypothetical protein